MPLGDGYDHLSSWLFNAPDRRLCEVIVTPDRVVLVSGAKQQQHQQLLLQRQQDQQQEGGEEGVIGITELARYPEDTPKGAEEYQGGAQWRLVADLLGLPPPWRLKPEQQQQEQQPGDSQQQQLEHQQPQQQQVEDDFVDVYSSMELAETHKITSRKNDARLLCFYFNATKVGVIQTGWL